MGPLPEALPKLGSATILSRAAAAISVLKSLLFVTLPASMYAPPFR